MIDQDDAEDILQDVFEELVEAYRLTDPIEQIGTGSSTGSARRRKRRCRISSSPMKTIASISRCLPPGVLPGVFNVVTGSGRAVGEAIGCHRDIDMVSFTGSTATGRKFLAYSSESNLKKVVLEMGGKNPCVVMPDIVDIDAVAAHIVNGALWNMGENCSAISRLIVHRDIKAALLDKIKALEAE